MKTPAICLSTLLVAAVSPLPALAAGAAAQGDAPTGTGSPETTAQMECDPEALVTLHAARLWEAALSPGEVRCLEIDLEVGEFVRARVEIDSPAAMFGLAIEVWPPQSSGGSEPSLRIRPTLGSAMNRVPLSWEATSDGRHLVILRDLWIWADSVEAAPVQLWIDMVEPPELVRARSDALVGDPRVEWLARHAVPVRSISPDDVDFGDLEPLREALRGVRVVLLGEATHGSGADFLAKSRLVKFLHEELGFDVLALEAGMYGMAVSWDSLRAGMPGREALELGTWRMWSAAREMQPLIDYVVAEAAGERPLQLAGFDNQFMPHGASVGFIEDLTRFARDRGVHGPLIESGTLERRALEAMSVMRFRRGEEPLPSSAVQQALVRALEETAERLRELENDAEGQFWAEVLRGTYCHAQRVWAEEGEDDQNTPARCLRDRQMARHLVWLANERFPGRKIIAWAANAHIMRTDDLSPAAGAGPSLGQGVWEALGEESYAIGTTSYRGTYGLAGAPTPQHVMVDQDPLPEFEELMEAAGFEQALLDLRRAKADRNWTAGGFRARPDGHLTEERVWSRALDALLFIREQRQPRRVDSPR